MKGWQGRAEQVISSSCTLGGKQASEPQHTAAARRARPCRAARAAAKDPTAVARSWQLPPPTPSSVSGAHTRRRQAHYCYTTMP